MLVTVRLELLFMMMILNWSQSFLLLMLWKDLNSLINPLLHLQNCVQRFRTHFILYVLKNSGKLPGERWYSCYFDAVAENLFYFIKMGGGWGKSIQSEVIFILLRTSKSRATILVERGLIDNNWFALRDALLSIGENVLENQGSDRERRQLAHQIIILSLAVLNQTARSD
jgi:hypothetical protein